MADDVGYATIGICVLIFLFQLIIIWYLWWVYGQLNENDNDMTDMLIDIYRLEAIEAEANGRCVRVNIPKRALCGYNKRHKNLCDDNSTN